jgi:hypothetical protein
MTVLKGFMPYVWEGQNSDGGSIKAIAAKLKQYKATGALLKCADGGNWYPMWYDLGDGKGLLNRPATAVVQALQAEGIVVGCWDYQYGDPAPVTVNGYPRQGWQMELQLAQETITLAKPDFYAVNNELEYEAAGRWKNALQVAQALRTTAGTDYPLLNATVPPITQHPNSPWRQWADANFIPSPEMYWSFWRGQVDYGDPTVLVDGYNNDSDFYQLPRSPLIPIYCDAPLAGAQYAITDSELIAFLAALDPKATTCIMNWDYQSMDDAAWARAQKVSEWLSANDPQQRIDMLIAQARDAYTSANTLLSQVIPLLEAKA